MNKEVKVLSALIALVIVMVFVNLAIHGDKSETSKQEPAPAAIAQPASLDQNLTRTAITEFIRADKKCPQMTFAQVNAKINSFEREAGGFHVEYGYVGTCGNTTYNQADSNFDIWVKVNAQGRYEAFLTPQMKAMQEQMQKELDKMFQ